MSPLGRAPWPGVTLTKTNYVPQPDFSHVTTGLGPGVWAAFARGPIGASATSLLVTNNSKLDNYVTVTCPTSGSTIGTSIGVGSGPGIGPAGGALNSGQTVTASVVVQAGKASQTINVFLEDNFLANGGLGTTWTSTNSGDQQTITLTWTPTALSPNAMLYVYVSSPTTGDTFRVRNAIVSDGSSAPVYFDGDGAGNFWDGLVGNSLSHNYQGAGTLATQSGPAVSPSGSPVPSRRPVGGVPLSPPIVSAVGVTSLTATSVTLVGTINTQGLAGTYWFVWGVGLPEPENVTGSAAASASVIPSTIQASITGLAAGQTYWWGVYGQTAGGKVRSNLLSFVPTAPETPTGGLVSRGVTTAISTPHFSWPFTVTSTGVEVVEQDTDGDVSACVDAIVSCTIGAWAQDPGFGLPDMVFSQFPFDPISLEATITRWEPRATETVVENLTLGGNNGDWTIQFDTEVTHP